MTGPCASTPRLWTIAMLVLASAACDSSNKLQSISIAPGASVFDRGSRVQLTARGTYRDGTTTDLTSTVAWSSTDTSVASVASSGVASGSAPGSATVSADFSGVRASTTVKVVGFAAMDLRQVNATGDNPAMQLDGRGRHLLAYMVLDASLDPPRLQLRTQEGSAGWPPAWSARDLVAEGPWSTTEADIQLASNAAGVSAMVFRHSSDGLNDDLNSFGVAYYDGAAWRWALTQPGKMYLQFRREGASGTPVVAVDRTGTAFVAYQEEITEAPFHNLCVARFDAEGLVDVTRWPEPVGQLLVAANAAGQVLVVNTLAGSHLFDGATWGSLQELPVNPGSDAVLALDGSDQAMLVGFDGLAQAMRLGPSGWSVATVLNSSANSSAGAAAVDSAGATVAAFATARPAGDLMTVRVSSGASWGPEIVVDGNGSAPAVFSNVRALAAGPGLFVVMWDAGIVTRATWFDGTWHTVVDLAPSSVRAPAAAVGSEGQILIIGDRGIEGLPLYAASYILQR